MSGRLYIAMLRMSMIPLSTSTCVTGAIVIVIVGFVVFTAVFIEGFGTRVESYLCLVYNVLLVY